MALVLPLCTLACEAEQPDENERVGEQDLDDTWIAEDRVGLAVLPLDTLVPVEMPGFANQVMYEARSFEREALGAERAIFLDWSPLVSDPDTLYHALFVDLIRYGDENASREFVLTDPPLRVGELRADTASGLPVMVLRFERRNEARFEIIYREVDLVIQVKAEKGLSGRPPGIQRVEADARGAFLRVVGRHLSGIPGAP